MGGCNELFFVFRLNPEHEIAIHQIGNHLPIAN
jgi:hypothetical protein